jgi:hypothetical protein
MVKLKKKMIEYSFRAFSRYPLYLFVTGSASLRPQQKRMSFLSGLWLEVASLTLEITTEFVKP